MKEALAQARKAWEAARDSGDAMKAAKAAAAYAHQIVAAFHSDTLTKAEGESLTREIRDWAKTVLPPGMGDLVEKLAAAGLPDDVIHVIAERVSQAYASGDTEAFGVVHVDSNGVATAVELTPDHAADGIGRPIGNA